MLVVPREAVHIIDENSPLFGITTMEQLQKMNAEFILIFEGIIQTTGLMLHARTSYRANEIRFGYRYV